MTTEPLRHEPIATRHTLAVWLTVLTGGITVVLRLVPHLANCLPLGAMGLFGGAKLRGWKPYLLPISVMLISDVALWIKTGFDSQYLFEFSRFYVYGSFLIYVLIGRLLRNRESALAVSGASLLGSLQFFLITNFCVWLFQPLESMDLVPAAFRYSRDLSGVLSCFASGLPFFQGDSPLELHKIFVGDPRFGAVYLVVGDLLFTFALFVLNGAFAAKTEPAEYEIVQPSMQTTPQ